MLSSSGWSLRTPSVLTRFVIFTVLSLALMVIDHRGQHLAKIRAGLSVVFYPIEIAATIPARMGESVLNFVGGNGTLKRKYNELAARQPLLEAKLERYDALEAQNTHLRKLLGSAALVADRAVVAKILQVSEEPFTRKIVIDKGSMAGVHKGQPVIDNHGIMGQVTEVDPVQSRVTLITDPGHAIPVEDTRNGLRAIVFGTGDESVVAVRYLTAPTDIKVGDLLVSSGIGGTFPFGYPVARVTTIVNDPNEPFLDIHAHPVAHLEYNKEVLLIWPTKTSSAGTLPPVSGPNVRPMPPNGTGTKPDEVRQPLSPTGATTTPRPATGGTAGTDHGH
ncbi:MAG: rod shape-determining protein MreC [Acidiferrobacterales bacterium]